MRIIRAMLVDDDPEWRMGISSFLLGHSQIELVFSVSTLKECFCILHNEQVDIVIMDIVFCDFEETGLEATRKITNDFPNVKVIIFSSIERNDEILQEAFMAGAMEYVNKMYFEQLPEIILSVANSYSASTHEVPDIVIEAASELSDEILERVSAGLAWGYVKCPFCGSSRIAVTERRLVCEECRNQGK